MLSETGNRNEVANQRLQTARLYTATLHIGDPQLAVVLVGEALYHHALAFRQQGDGIAARHRAADRPDLLAAAVKANVLVASRAASRSEDEKAVGGRGER